KNPTTLPVFDGPYTPGWGAPLSAAYTASGAGAYCPATSRRRTAFAVLKARASGDGIPRGGESSVILRTGGIRVAAGSVGSVRSRIEDRRDPPGRRGSGAAVARPTGAQAR
ncbi:hypothetical protein, partial [Streptosporangium sp. NPDC049046]|uniref:hypothetical protein n=1 Tax=Streptosporangium sp. NPDC049046 TaxID=3155031 RepID=UPI00342E3540